MSKLNSNEVAFKDKYKDRIENIGKKGIASIMDNKDSTPINKNDFQGNINDCKIYVKKI
jgi:hypothetical protein